LYDAERGIGNMDGAMEPRGRNECEMAARLTDTFACGQHPKRVDRNAFD
jgi:hypothetical protein